MFDIFMQIWSEFEVFEISKKYVGLAKWCQVKACYAKALQELLSFILLVWPNPLMVPSETPFSRLTSFVLNEQFLPIFFSTPSSLTKGLRGPDLYGFTPNNFMTAFSFDSPQITQKTFHVRAFNTVNPHYRLITMTIRNCMHDTI